MSDGKMRIAEADITRGILMSSSLWQELTSELDVMAMADVGILDINSWPECDHEEVRTWAVAGTRDEMPSLIKDYLDKCRVH